MTERFRKYILLAAAVLAIQMSAARTPDGAERNGRYRIGIVLGDTLNGTAVSGIERLYLAKYVWGGGRVIIDSAAVTGKEAVFEGKSYSIRTDAGVCDSLFTAGEYEVFAEGNLRLFKFFYSYTGKGMTDCVFRATEDSRYLTDFEVVSSRKSLKERYGRENKLYSELQNYWNLLALMMVDAKPQSAYAQAKARSRYGNDLKSVVTSIAHDAATNMQGSLLETFTKYCTSDENPVTPDNRVVFADERLFYTSFGEKILSQMLGRLELNGMDSVKNGIDRILSNRYITGGRMKAGIALTVFDHFAKSKIMSSANAAVYVAENYILGKGLPVSPERYFEIQYYTAANKNTLLGCKAPELRMKDTSGVERSLNELLGEYTIIYFYSDDCIHCKTETPKLMDFLDSYTRTPVNIYAVYTGTDRDGWKKYIRENFSTLNPFVNRIDVADPERESRFAADYGITSTPAEFLLNNGHRIIGRKLRVENIGEILGHEHERHFSLFRYFSTVFPEERQGGVGADERCRRIDGIRDMLTAGGRNDLAADSAARDNYCDIFRELYLFLSSSDLYDNQIAAAYLAERYIIPEEGLWEDRVFYTNIKKALRAFNMNKLGEKAADALLYDISGSPADLLAGAGLKVLFFYKPTCSICVEYAGELKKIFAELGDKLGDKFGEKNRRLSISGIYILDDYSSWKRFAAKEIPEWNNLWDKNHALEGKYDLENIPSIYLIGEDNTVIAKDITPDDLREILKMIYR